MSNSKHVRLISRAREIESTQGRLAALRFAKANRINIAGITPAPLSDAELALRLQAVRQAA